MSVDLPKTLKLESFFSFSDTVFQVFRFVHHGYNLVPLSWCFTSAETVWRIRDGEVLI